MVRRTLCGSANSGDNEPGRGNDPGMGLDLAGVDLLTETVSTPRLLLRPWTLDDADEVFRACQDAASRRWLVALPSPYTLDDARMFVTELSWEDRRSGTGLTAAMQDRLTGRPVGSIGLMPRPATLGPEIGYWVAPWARGRGYAAEATDRLTSWAFRHGAHRVSLLAATANVASQRCAERAGFTREGVLREAEVDREGVRRDLVLFGRLSTDPPPADLRPG